MAENQTLLGNDRRAQEAIIFTFLAAFSLLLPCIIFGNALTILAVCKNHRLRTPTNVIHASLALTDLLTGFLAVPFQIFIMIDIFTCRTQYASMVSFTSVFFGGVSFLHAFAVTADRYLAITRPFQYTSSVTNKRVGIVVAVMWGLSATFFVARAAVILTASSAVTFCFGGSFLQIGSSVTMNWGLFGLFFLMTTTLVIANARILRIAIKQSNAVSNQVTNVTCRNDVNQQRSDGLKAVKTTTLIVGTFVLCWSPVQVFMLFRLTSEFGDIFRAAMSGMAMIVMDVSSMVNPIIYFHTSRDFRTAFSDIFRSFKKCRIYSLCRPSA